MSVVVSVGGAAAGSDWLAITHTVAEIVAALMTSASVTFLVWDRFKPRPIEIGSRLEIRDTVLPDAARADVYLANAMTELPIVTAVHAPRGFKIASAYNMTAARMRALDPAEVKWTHRLRYSRRLSREQSPDEAVVRLFIRPDDQRPTWRQRFRHRRRGCVMVEGQLPFRGHARFTLAAGPSGAELRRKVAGHTNRRTRKGRATVD